jgi:hypothetical protein
MSCRRGTVFLSLPTHIYRHCCDTGDMLKKKAVSKDLFAVTAENSFYYEKHFVVGILTLNKSEVK